MQALTTDSGFATAIFGVTGVRSIKNAGDLLILCTIHKASEMARLELYFGWALRSARAGQLEAAREVALETVGHVTLEDPRPHALLGELAVALRDTTLLKEAQTFLRFLMPDRVTAPLDRGAAAAVAYQRSS